MLNYNTFERKVKQAAETGTTLNLEVVRFFLDELYQAVDHGRIMTRDRMLQLWPIIREINEEQTEIKRRTVDTRLVGGVR